MKLAGEFKLMRTPSRFALLAAATILTPPVFAATPQSVPMPTLVSQVSIPHSMFRLNNGLTVLEPPIPKSVRFAEAPAAGRSVLATARRTRGAEAYRALADGLFG